MLRLCHICGSMTGMVDADFVSGTEAGAVLLVEEELSPSTEDGGDWCTAVDSVASDDVDFQIKRLRKEAAKEVKFVKMGVQKYGQSGKNLWNQVKRVHCGLKNIGNSCYMNSVMQCLSAVDRADVHSSSSERLIVEYEALVKLLRNPKDAVVTPSRFKRSLGKMDGRFRNTEPQDAHELLMFLLEELKKGRLRKGDSGTVEKLSFRRLMSTLTCCSCSHQSISVEDFNCLSLQISNEPNQTVIDCLKAFFNEELIPVEGGWRCNKCDQISAGKKQLSMEKCPDLLMVHLNRFHMLNGRILKNEVRVGIPLAIEVAEFKYRLVAVVNHSGSRTSGHYSAEVKKGSGWICFNDDRVSDVSRTSMQDCTKGYLLFYGKSQED